MFDLTHYDETTNTMDVPSGSVLPSLYTPEPEDAILAEWWSVLLEQAKSEPPTEDWEAELMAL